MLEELMKLLKEKDEAYKEFRSKYDEKCDEVNNKICYNYCFNKHKTKSIKII